MIVGPQARPPSSVTGLCWQVCSYVNVHHEEQDGVGENDEALTIFCIFHMQINHCVLYKLVF